MTVRLRFAPSPTGYLHIGGARSALFTWMYARRHGGQFILRIEDTDLKRTREGAFEDITDSLRWLGIHWDEGPDIGGPHAPYVQTERKALYQEWADWLVDHGHAYRCYCTPDELRERRQAAEEADRPFKGYDQRCRHLTAEERAEREDEGHEYVIRFKMPGEGTTVVPDLVRGEVTVANNLVADYVILKSNGLPTYHLAHPVDDHFMGITHVTRGVEWLSTAPLHVRIFEAFGWPLPVYIHLPVILNPSGKGKLSKRTQAFNDEGEQIYVRVEEFREAGYLPQAVVNFLANVGWSYGDDREKFTIEEAIARFDLAAINPSETRLPYEKLDWLNGLYIQDLSAGELVAALQPFLEVVGYRVDPQALLHLAPTLNVRLKRLTDAVPLLQFLFQDEAPTLQATDLSHKQLPLATALAAFQAVRDFVVAADPFDLESIAGALTAIGEAHTTSGKAGPFLGRMRLAVTGQPVSPPLYESMLALGREKVLARLDQAIAVLAAEVEA